VRIIAGRLGGRLFQAPRNTSTHPMSDRARGGLFNTLGDISGMTVLDAFAGSGALSFEAVSRGAASVVAIENDRAAQLAITKSIAALDIGNEARLVKASAGSWLVTNPNAQFDLIICDPPYDDPHTDLLTQLAKRVRPDGVFVVSWPAKQTPPSFAGLTQLSAHAYAGAQLIFWRAKSAGKDT